MVQRVAAIAHNTYRESVRARILLGLAGVAFAVALYSMIVGAFTLNDAPRVVSDLGAASISIFSLAVAVVIGATSLHRELEQKTVFPILARPIHRGEYLVGKYLGTLLTIGVFIAADAGLVLLLTAMTGGAPAARVLGVAVGLVLLLAVGMWRLPKWRSLLPIPWAVLLFVAGALLSADVPVERRLIVSSSALSLVEVGVVAAFATLFSSFSTPFLSAIFTVGIFVVGRQADSLAKLPEKFFGPAITKAGVFLSKIVPNLQVYVPARPLLVGEVPEHDLPTYVALATASGVAWIVGLLAVATFIFRRRDFL